MDNNKIFERVKMKIAISNVKEEDIAMNKSELNLGKCIGIAACIVFSMTGVVFATTQIINKFGANSSDGVQTAINHGYYSDVNTEYRNVNGISASIESLLIDDSNFAMNINIKFDNRYNLKDILKDNKNIDIIDLKVMNERNENVFATHEVEIEKDSKKYINSYNGSYSNNIELINDNEIKYTLIATGNTTNFPMSQKLKITFSKIRFGKCDDDELTEENKNSTSIIYQGEWDFEIDIPSKMTKSNIVNYKLVSISDENYKFESAEVSSTAFKIYLSNCDEISWNDKECVETSNGDKFYPAYKSDGDGEISILEDGIVKYCQTFNLTKYDATENLKVHIFKSNGEEIIIELEKDN